MTDTPTIDTYLDAAEARLIKLYGLKKCSDRELARRLNLANASVSAWRTKRAYPDDATMQRLAEIADMNVPEALAWLGVWRNDGPVAQVYETMARRLGRTAAAFFCAALFAAGFLGAGAAVLSSGRALASPTGAPGTSAEQSDADGRGTNLYYGKYRRPRRRRIDCLLAAARGLIRALLLACCAAGAAVAQPRDVAGDAAASWADSVVSVHNRSSGELCTGVAVAPGLVATAAHCVGAGARLEVGHRGRHRAAAIAATGGFAAERVDYVTAAADWALLRVPGLAAPALPIAPLDAVQIRARLAAGAALATAGFGPGAGRMRVIDRCRLGAVWGRDFLTTSCQIAHRDSGGPLVLLDGGRAVLVGLQVGFDDRPAAARGDRFTALAVAARCLRPAMQMAASGQTP